MKKTNPRIHLKTGIYIYNLFFRQKPDKYYNLPLFRKLQSQAFLEEMFILQSLLMDYLLFY